MTAFQMRSVPSWATDGQVMLCGVDLQPGDTVYFSEKAMPRFLQSNLGQGTWKCITIADSFGWQRQIHGTCTIDTNRWYVVKRKVVKAPVVDHFSR